MARDKYEISLWEDYLVSETGQSTIPEHFEEKKIVVIGSDTMTSACRAYEPRLVENVNGTSTFTFKMYYVYTDEQTGEKRQNPYLNLLVNERKVKVYWKSKWYDLVIKDIQEDSSGKSITYTCKDLFINELSKNGFNLEFNDDLKNNQGTAVYLGTQILDGTEWTVDEEHSSVIKQLKEEPVYEAYTADGSSWSIYNQTTATSVTLTGRQKILIFYSCVEGHTSDCQFLYDPAQVYKRDQNSQLVTGVDCYVYYNTQWDGNRPNFVSSASGDMGTAVSNEYRGSRLVDSAQTVFDPLTQKYVTVYKAINSGTGYSVEDTIYGYDSTEYKDATFVNSLITNANNFASKNGWIGPVGAFELYPAFTEDTDISQYDAKSYLKLNNGTVFNTGLSDSSSYIPDGIQKGQRFVFRFKARSTNPDDERPYITTGLITPHIYAYDAATNTPIISDFIQGDGLNDQFVFQFVGGWVECSCICKKSFSRNQIYNYVINNNYYRLGFFFDVGQNLWLEDIQFYPEVYGNLITEQGEEPPANPLRRINPGDMNIESIAEVYHYYYNYTTHADATVLDDYLYVGIDPWPGLEDMELQTNAFKKIRSITAKQSNRFNLLQTVAETFECWCRFTIDHWGDPDFPITNGVSATPGQIVFNNGVPCKHVTFVERVGQVLPYGFVYGIDLKTITRNIQSDQIVTKTIVLPNSNEFAIDGFCTIARSPENYSKDTCIYNFDYYIRQGLLDGGELNKDLYAQFAGNPSRGYYSLLRGHYEQYDSDTAVLVQKGTELTKQESYKTVYEGYLSSLRQEKTNLESIIQSLANVSSWEDVASYMANNPDMEEIKTRLNAHQNCVEQIHMYETAYNNILTSIRHLTKTLELKQQDQQLRMTAIKALNTLFYKKYAHYIQEGSWIDESYIDDNLYYLDALSVAYTSSRPQVSYNISVARLSSLEEFKNKIFNLGDISYIQDTEFFGYTYRDEYNNYLQQPTPIKEEVVIAEITSYFDDPVNDSFVIQNYKTQFEDLFQRITATTQSLQYASGGYDKAANLVDTNGTIKVEALQDAIAYNNNLVIQANNEQIFQDSTGLTVTDATNPSNRTKITSGGVFISTDGGATWKNAIRGEGIATQYLTAGNINTQYITLLDGEHQAFRWDSTGINAYYGIENQGQIAGINIAKAVRFDRYGIYGIDGVTTDAGAYKPTSEADIWDKAKFGMTWEGFFVKNKYDDHYVEVSSTNDIQVVDTSGTDEVARVKIGKLSAPEDENDVYGFRLKDAAGTTTLETVSDGTLWLKDALHIGFNADNEYLANIGNLPLITDPSQQIIWDPNVSGETGHQNSPNLDLYRVTRDTEPITGKVYYYYVVTGENPGYREFSGASFDPTVIYFEAANTNRTIEMNNRFVVWKDGTVYARDGYFDGTVYARKGVLSDELQIGYGDEAITLKGLTDSTLQVRIISQNGTIFNGRITTTLTAQVWRGSQQLAANKFNYNWYKDSGSTSIGTTESISVDLLLPSGTPTTTYKCIVTFKEADENGN